jgi:hypothetical protein
MSKKFIKDVNTAVFSMWLIFSTFAFAFLAVLFFFEPSDIYSLSSLLQSPHDDACTFCGMTRSIVNITKGNSSHGTVLNEAAFPFFSLLILNQVIFVIYLTSKLFKIKE